MIRIEDGLIALETNDTGYYLAKRNHVLENIHYGRKIHPDRKSLMEKMGTGYGTDVVYSEEIAPDSLLHLCLDLSPDGKGDFRRKAVAVEFADGSRVCDWRYESVRIQKGCVAPEGLPAAFGGEETLILTYKVVQGLEADLLYTVYPDCNVITRRIRFRNVGEEPVTLRRCLSYQLDLPRTGYVISTFTGAWARERQETICHLTTGVHSFGSETGNSSHFCNPFFMVYENLATENYGNVYGFNLIYSGSHLGQVEVGPYSKTRIQAGIQPEGFAWTLQPGENFDTPEGALTFSSAGKNGMSQNMHHFIREHIVRGTWAKKERPILLNNWEATYFDFKESTLLKLAKEAKKLGVELFVLDDGWFGERDSDTKGLGDYEVNRKKLPSGLDGLCKKINEMGMTFGIWVEPEMVNPDSNLYRSHPDWVVRAPEIEPSLGRNQLVLDLCRQEVQEYLIQSLDEVLSSAPIGYVKWDMNRHMTDCYSPVLKEQGRFAHAWMKGLYGVLKHITKAHPEVLFEACASGGNRFDLGMLCYMPQIWTSDDTDAWERMKIQTGTSYGYPQSVMGCHVSAAPNHQTLRNTQLETRFDVAAFGILGYELDLTKASHAEKKVMAEQIQFYKKYRQLLQFGRFMRVESLGCKEENSGKRCVWMVVSEEKKEALVFEAIGQLVPNSETEPLRLIGLDPERAYQITSRKQLMDIRNFGSLLNAVLPLKVRGDGMLVHLASDYYMHPIELENYTAYGDLLMEAGIRQKPRFVGTGYSDEVRMMPDYGARIYILTGC